MGRHWNETLRIFGSAGMVSNLFEKAGEVIEGGGDCIQFELA